MVPVYIALREEGGVIGLAIASSAAIMIYVMTLGWLQRRRFEREATARGTTLEGTQGMLQTALRLGIAALVAIGLGLLTCAQLLRWLPDVYAVKVLGRAIILSSFGLCIYAAMARLLGVSEISEVQLLLVRKLRLGRKASLAVSSDNSNPVAP
jgi:putative peptidoglycan lipid II flippase